MNGRTCCSLVLHHRSSFLLAHEASFVPSLLFALRESSSVLLALHREVLRRCHLLKQL